MTIKKDEYVLVFPSSILKDIGLFQGLTSNINEYLHAIMREHKFIRRSDAEADENYKQLIPYAIFACNNTILRYQRGDYLSEKRLLSKYSIGIGGHISVNDPNLFSSSYHEGMIREVNEELSIDSTFTEVPVALLNDDSDEVGRVHFGIIHIFHLNEPKVRKREKSIIDPKFISIGRLKSNISKYENWSQICITNLDKLLKH